jgi:endonuclease YncB( thermonuclease family)
MNELGIPISRKFNPTIIISNVIASRWYATRKRLYLGLCLTILSAGPAYADITARVINIIDGDTIKIRLDGNAVKVRLQGIDAPELGQPFNKEATRHLKSLIAGETVTIKVTKTDRYGRIIGQLFAAPKGCKSCPHTWDVNLEQVKAGYAWWYEYYANEQTWSDRRNYKTAQSSARKAGLGLWADPNPVNPYDWRKQKRYK